MNDEEREEKEELKQKKNQSREYQTNQPFARVACRIPLPQTDLNEDL